MDFSSFYLDLLVTERHWSWAVVGIVYLLFAILIRVIVFRRMVQETKKIDPQLYSGVKKIYLKNSVSGWVLFFISFLALMALWLGWEGVLRGATPGLLLFLAILLLFFLSVILHLTAFTKAILSVLRQRVGVGREF